MLLEDEDFDVVEAADGTAALERADSSIDLVLLDLKLPDTSGFDVCRQLRASSDIPIVMVTAQIDSYDMVAGLSAGADDYVTKPFIPKVLVARIRALLRRRARATTSPAGCAAASSRSRRARASRRAMARCCS